MLQCVRVGPQEREIRMAELHTAGSWKKIVPALAALGLLLALQLTGMSAASAAPTHSAATVAHTQGAQPGTTPSGTFRVFYPTLPAGGYWWVHCTANNEGNNPAPGFLVAPSEFAFVSVENLCSVRIWLAQYSNGTGYKLCLSPNGDSGYVNIYRSYQDIGVSANGSDC